MLIYIKTDLKCVFSSFVYGVFFFSLAYRKTSVILICPWRLGFDAWRQQHTHTLVRRNLLNNNAALERMRTGVLRMYLMCFSRVCIVRCVCVCVRVCK